VADLHVPDVTQTDPSALPADSTSTSRLTTAQCSNSSWAAAFYLCDSGADRGQLRAAIFAYNHADSYVNQVLARDAAETNTATALDESMINALAGHVASFLVSD